MLVPALGDLIEFDLDFPGLVLAFRTWAQQAVLEEVRMAKNVDVLEPEDRLLALMVPPPQIINPKP